MRLWLSLCSWPIRRTAFLLYITTILICTIDDQVGRWFLLVAFLRRFPVKLRVNLTLGVRPLCELNPTGGEGVKLGLPRFAFMTLVKEIVPRGGFKIIGIETDNVLPCITLLAEDGIAIVVVIAANALDCERLFFTFSILSVVSANKIQGGLDGRLMRCRKWQWYSVGSFCHHPDCSPAVGCKDN